jgi:hypothetical protein
MELLINIILVEASIILGVAGVVSLCIGLRTIIGIFVNSEETFTYYGNSGSEDNDR